MPSTRPLPPSKSASAESEAEKSRIEWREADGTVTILEPDHYLGRMQTSGARDARNRLFRASTEELGRAANAEASPFFKNIDRLTPVELGNLVKALEEHYGVLVRRAELLLIERRPRLRVPRNSHDRDLSLRVRRHSRNPFAWVSAVRAGLRQSGVDAAEVERFTDEALEAEPSGLLEVLARWAPIAGMPDLLSVVKTPKR